MRLGARYAVAGLPASWQSRHFMGADDLAALVEVTLFPLVLLHVELSARELPARERVGGQPPACPCAPCALGTRLARTHGHAQSAFNPAANDATPHIASRPSAQQQPPIVPQHAPRHQLAVSAAAAVPARHDAEHRLAMCAHAHTSAHSSSSTAPELCPATAPAASTCVRPLEQPWTIGCLGGKGETWAQELAPGQCACSAAACWHVQLQHAGMLSRSCTLWAVRPGSATSAEQPQQLSTASARLVHSTDSQPRKHI